MKGDDMSTLIDLTGNRYGRLTALSIAVRAKHGKSTMWLCLCDCSTRTIVQSQHLRHGKIKSCGCIKKGPKTKKFECFGINQTLRKWSYFTGIKQHTLYSRINRGWSTERALTTTIKTSE